MDKKELEPKKMKLLSFLGQRTRRIYYAPCPRGVILLYLVTLFWSGKKFFLTYHVLHTSEPAAFQFLRDFSGRLPADEVG